MAFFAVQYTYIPDAAKVQEYRPEHREFLANLHDQGIVKLSGPVATEPGQALIIVTGESAEEVGHIMDADPFQQHQVIAERSIAEWNVVIGSIN